jgi:Tfp pilus assembly protein PilF
MDSRLVMAERLIDVGDLKKAERYISEILKKEPSSLKALLLKARIAEKQGKKKELKKIYKKVHSLKPKNETVLYNLGVLNYESGDLKSSLTYFKKYIKMEPKDASAHEILFDIYRRQKNEKMAFEEAKIIVKLNPKKVDPYYFMFGYLDSRGKYKEIIPIMQQGIKSNPKQTNLREQLLFAYLKTGQDDMALKQMGELLKIKPNDVGLLLQMARLLEKQESFTEALETYKKIINLSPDNEEAEEAYLRLRLKGIRSK